VALAATARRVNALGKVIADHVAPSLVDLAAWFVASSATAIQVAPRAVTDFQFRAAGNVIAAHVAPPSTERAA
jgi:hypothetical protein